MGIEEVAQKCPECLFKIPVSVKNGPTDAQLQKLAKEEGLREEESRIMQKLSSLK